MPRSIRPPHVEPTRIDCDSESLTAREIKINHSDYLNWTALIIMVATIALYGK